MSAWTPVFVERFAGIPVKNVAVRCDGESTRGELMVTEHGLEGGAVYALSRPLHDEIDRSGGSRTCTSTCVPIWTVPQCSPAWLVGRPKDSRSTVLRSTAGSAARGDRLAARGNREPAARRRRGAGHARARTFPWRSPGPHRWTGPSRPPGGSRSTRSTSTSCCADAPAPTSWGRCSTGRRRPVATCCRRPSRPRSRPPGARSARFGGSATDGAQHHELG